MINYCLKILETHLKITNNMTALRLDVSKKIGFGHFKRMQALSKFVGLHIFIINLEGKDILSKSGIPKKNIVILDQKLDEWWKHIKGLTHIITDIMYTGNSVNAAIEISNISQTSFKLIVIDGMPPDNYIPIKEGGKPDLLLIPYHTDKKSLYHDFQFKCLVGAKFAILDSKFLKIRHSFKKSNTPSILVTCGASDPNGLSLKILKSLSPSPCQIDIILGPLFNSSLCKDLIDFSNSENNIKIHYNISDIIPFLQKATLVIGRPGLTRYEAAVLGCYGIYLWDTKGHKDYFQGLTKSGIGDFYTSSQVGDEDKFFIKLKRIAKKIDVVPNKQNKIAMKIVDGLGSLRLMKEIGKL